MTTKEILEALRNERCVVMGDDNMKVFRRDLFGDLVVVDLSCHNEPVRKATDNDIECAKIMDVTKKH